MPAKESSKTALDKGSEESSICLHWIEGTKILYLSALIPVQDCLR